jgi:putative transposase
VEIPGQFSVEINNLSELRIPHDPTTVGIDAFRHLGTSRRSALAAAEAEEVLRPEASGFAGMGGGAEQANDGLDFDY